VTPKATHVPYGKLVKPLVFQIEIDPGELWPLDPKNDADEYNKVVSI
jgi:hypothetical protein